MTWTIAIQSDDSTFSVDTNGRVIRRHVRQYLLKSDSATFQSSYEAGLALGINAGDVHPVDDQARVRVVHPVRKVTRGAAQAWDVTIEWSTETADVDTESTVPENRRVIRSESTSDQQRYIIRDKNGVLIVDSAGSPFDGGIPVNVKLGTITFTRNETHGSQYYVGKANVLSGRVNSISFLGGEPATVMLDVTANEVYEGDYHYWAVTYTFIYDPLGWQPTALNAGFYKLVDGERVRILEDGEPATEPAPLDSAGAIVPVADRPDSCIFKTVDYFETENFNTFGLPLT